MPQLPPFMKVLLVALLLASLSSGALAQVLYTEAFDAEATAKVSALATGDTVVRYLDYSEFTVGGEDFMVEEAPNRIEGSADTRGVLFLANLSEAAANTVNLLATESPGGALLSLSGPYLLRFDVFMGLGDPIPESGSTEQVLWSLGADGVLNQGRPQRENPDNNGIWGWLAGEGGYSTEDSVIYEANELLEKKDNLNHSEEWAMAFDDQRPVPTIPANAWTEVLVEAFSDRTRVFYNGHLFHEVATSVGASDGTVMVGYEDPFGSLSGAPDFQWGLIDNVVVEAIVEPPIEPVSDSGFAPVSEDGATSTNEVTVANRRDVPITISSGSFSGADAADFSLVTELPITVPAREQAEITLQFAPGPLGGLRQASLDLVTDDAEAPNVSISVEAMRLGLLAHYPLDETEGEVMADASGNGLDGRYLTADGGRITLGQPSLATGTSVRLDPQGDAGVAVGELPASAALGDLGTFSVAMWFEFDAEDAGTGSVLFARGSSLAESSALVVLAQDQPQPLQWLVDAELGAITDDELVQIGTPYHLVFTYVDSDLTDPGADRLQIFLDGELVQETAPVDLSTAFSAEAVFQFGGFQGTSGLLGLIDDIQLYSKELSAEEATFLFANPGETLVGDDVIEPPVDETLDSDRDGVPDVHEAIAMTDPLDPNSVLRILQADPVTGVTWSSVPGVSYRLDRSIDLVTWVLLAEDVLADADGETTTLIDEGEAAQAVYYRIAPNP